MVTFLSAPEKPDGAIQFIGPNGASNLANELKPNEKLTWPFKDDALTAGEGHIATSMPIKHFKAHIEFKIVLNPSFSCLPTFSQK